MHALHAGQQSAPIASPRLASSRRAELRRLVSTEGDL